MSHCMHFSCFIKNTLYSTGYKDTNQRPKEIEFNEKVNQSNLPPCKGTQGRLMMEEGVGEEAGGTHSLTPLPHMTQSIQYNTIGANKSPPKLHKSSIYHTHKCLYLVFNFLTKLEGGHGVEAGTHGEGWWGDDGFGVAKMLKPTTHIYTLTHKNLTGVKERGENFVDPPFLSKA
jgi:hypothetical protein